jgi:uncharacterized protein YjbI with pentapeptide repeats
MSTPGRGHGAPLTNSRLGFVVIMGIESPIGVAMILFGYAGKRRQVKIDHGRGALCGGGAPGVSWGTWAPLATHLGCHASMKISQMNSEILALITDIHRMNSAGENYTNVAQFFNTKARDSQGKPKLNLAGASLQGLKMQHFDFSGMDLSGTTFGGCNLEQANFQRAVLDDCVFAGFNGDKTFIRGADFTKASARGAEFACDVQGVKFAQTDLSKADFSSVDLRGVKFQECSFQQTDFSEVIATTTTKFVGCDPTHKMRMSRYTLACLGPDYGGLTEGNRMDMDIVDDDARRIRRFLGPFAHNCPSTFRTPLRKVLDCSIFRRPLPKG